MNLQVASGGRKIALLVLSLSLSKKILAVLRHRLWAYIITPLFNNSLPPLGKKNQRKKYFSSVKLSIMNKVGRIQLQDSILFLSLFKIQKCEFSTLAKLSPYSDVNVFLLYYIWNIYFAHGSHGNKELYKTCAKVNQS